MSHYLCRISDIGEHGREVILHRDSDTRYIMLFRHDGTVHAWLNICPHKGLPLNPAPNHFLLGPGPRLTCAQHGATFDLRTGQCLEGPCPGATLHPITIKLEEDSVWLEDQAID